MKDGQAERAALASAGLRHYVKGNELHGNRDNVYVIEADALTEGVKDMLATLQVNACVHVCTERKVTLLKKQHDYAVQDVPHIGERATWVEDKAAAEGYHIKGRNFRCAS
jgi:hypothetical protein